MTVAVPPGGPATLPNETRRAIDRVYGAAIIMRVVFVMNLAAYLIGAMYTAASLFDRYGPTTPIGVLKLLGWVGVWLAFAGANGAGIYGTYQMENLRRRVWAVLAVLVVMLPCTSPCWLVTVPLGIWAFTGLRRVPYDAWS